MARDAFATFIPISVESDARTKIVFDFFDLMAAIAAHGKTNGMGGRKLSRLAGWWAFEQVDLGNGFDGGYKAWTRFVGYSFSLFSLADEDNSAADAASHLFFAYLRSLSPDSVKGTNGISALPLSLQTLVQATEYPPAQLNMTATSKVVMIVDSVSPTPFALLRRAKHFEYRDDDRALQEFSNYDDPVQALTEECRRVLRSISSTNQSTISTTKASTSLRDASWSRFEDIGFGGFGDYSDHEDEVEGSALGKKRKSPQGFGLRSAPQSKNDLGRPTTPSWADFLSSGFVDEPNNSAPAPLLLPSDKILPPIDTRRGQSSQSHRRGADDSLNLEPGELASINSIYYDDAFWWVWISSLAGEETTERKAVFGRCALIETAIRGGKWLIVEEIVKGAAPEPEQGAYIAEKKSRFGFSKRGKLTRTKSITQPYSRTNRPAPVSKTSIGPDQHARIQAAAAALQQKQRQQERDHTSPRRARLEDAASTKTNSVFTLQPIISEAVPAMKWASTYDKNAIRAAYLGNNFTGKGSTTDLPAPGGFSNPHDTNGYTSRPGGASLVNHAGGLPRDDSGLSAHGSAKDRDLPALPRADTPKHQALSSSTEERRPVPSASIPVTTSRNMPVSNEAAPQAAKAPLPATTPVEVASPSDEKPLPPVGQISDGLNKSPRNFPGHSGRDVDNGAVSIASSPESKKSSRKLAKTPTGTFKGFFGKKKPEVLTRPARPEPVDSTAVSAARAAYARPQMKPSANGSQPTIGRRLSLIGRKKASGSSAVPSPLVAPIQDSEERDISAPAPVPRNRFGSHDDSAGSKASLSRVNTSEERQANREFRSFDQGPLMDQPAFVPEDSPNQRLSDTSIPVAPVPEKHTQERQPILESQFQDHEVDLHRQPGERVFVREEKRNEPDVSESEDERSATPPLDRWALIRKNAAERAARLQNENLARPSHEDKTDSDGDGETNPEESK